MSQMQYRPDIDGLRAIAVLLVVTFHAFPMIVKGGFVGVDIFFVISGFLITTLLLKSTYNDNFSFADFYTRRIKRIFPALIFVLTCCYLFGWFALLGENYKQLGKHLASSAVFASNFVFWQEAGYFDKAAETKPFLHLWSLAIEEQFYIVWPLIIWSAWKKKLYLPLILLSLLLISFGINVFKVQRQPTEAFYSPITRFWELFSGALLAYLSLSSYAQSLFSTNKKIINCIASLGFGLITIAVFLLDKDKEFPGWWALLPCFGTVLIINAGQKAWLNRVFLSNPVLIGFGLISYSLYLWHWPILAFAHIFIGDVISTATTWSLVLFSITIAWFTYQFVEKPLRFSQKNPVQAGLVFSLIGLGILGLITYKKNGFNFRFKDKGIYASYFANSPPNFSYFHKINFKEKYRESCNFYDLNSHLKGNPSTHPKPAIASSCYTPTSDLTVFLWGDSHAQQLYYGLNKTLPKTVSLLQTASSGCPPLLVGFAKKEDHWCLYSNYKALEKIKKYVPTIVILAQSKKHEENKDLIKISEELVKIGVQQVYILGPSPQWPVALYELVLSKYWIYMPKRIKDPLKKHNQITEISLRKKYKLNLDKIKYVSLIEFFCNKKGCLSYVGKDRKAGLLLWDTAHLTPRASVYLAKNLLTPLIISKLNEINNRADLASRS